MGLNLDYLEGQTPIDEDEKDGLKIKSISTRGDLDEFEQKNIEDALQWILGIRFNSNKVFSEDFILLLHKKMFSDVWLWAGKIRRTNKKIGVEHWKIAISLRSLLNDVRYWYDNQIYSADEIAIRFKHRIVRIHCFSNGNGRHSRILADIINEKIFKQSAFTWGSKSYSDENEIRMQYLKALKASDNGSFDLLIRFARS